jgi:hypothetical protein
MGLEKNSHVVKGDDVLKNFPKSVLRGTGERLLPVKGSVLVDGGLDLPNLTGGFAGKAPDIGAYEMEFGAYWTGPRTYTAGGLGYGLPEGWEVTSADQLAALKDLGAPAKPENVALLITRKDPAAFVLVHFEALDEQVAWKRFDALTAGGEDDVVMKVLDSCVARVSKRDAGGKQVSALSGAQVDAHGVWCVTGGCEAKDLATVLPDFHLVFTSTQQTISVPDVKKMGAR